MLIPARTPKPFVLRIPVQFTASEIPGVVLVAPQPRSDDRGFFARVWCAAEFTAQGLNGNLAQASIAYSRRRGTLRGIHYQASPHWECKLVRCTRGAAYVVVVDLRPESSTHRRWVGVELTSENRHMLYVPVGCAQGYQTLADDTEMYYQMSVPYAPQSACGVRWDDPAFAVQWPLPPLAMSQADQKWPLYTA